MVRLHSTRQLAAIVTCIGFLTLLSDGAIVYGQPQQLDYERTLNNPNHADALNIESLSDLARVGISWDEAGRGEQNPKSLQEANALSNRGRNSPLSSKHLQTVGRPPPPSSYIPERYGLVPPEENFLRELLLHSAAPAETRNSNGQRRVDWNSGDFTLIENNADQLELKLPTVDIRSGRDWTSQENPPLYVKPKRLYQQSQQHYVRAGSLTEPKVTASKRWWGGGYQRTRGQMDRRASQSKHYDCLKSCIKEGKLHPIQCHTLC